MAKLLDPDFVPTGGQPGCELSGPPGVPHVETPHGHASVDAVDRTPGAGPSQGQSPAPDWTRDPRDAVEANLSSEARLADGDEGGGIVPIPGSSSPAETPSGDAPEARAERHLDRAASGVLFRRDEAAAMTVVELPSGLDLEILDEALEGGGSVSTVLRELRAELDAAIEAAELREPLPYPLPSPELVDLLALANRLRSSMVSGLFLGCRHVTEAEHKATFGSITDQVMAELRDEDAEIRRAARAADKIEQRRRGWSTLIPNYAAKRFSYAEWRDRILARRGRD